MSGLIQPRVLKGFRDFLPAQESQRRDIESTLVRVFESFGFVPIDTPMLEYAEVLLGKGGGDTDKQIYRFHDHGDRDVALRYDLTVPFARFMAAHANELYLPFKRYHIAKVFRGENTQRGRYREFTQCDFDAVGTDSASTDFEILETTYRSFTALGVPNVTIRMSHRGIFNAFLTQMNASHASAEILRTVDKLPKIGETEVRNLLSQIIDPKVSDRVLEFVKPESSFEATLEKMEGLSGGPSPGSERLREISKLISELRLEDAFVLDPSITRGLDYYTGIVYETFLNELPDIGAVSAGGRYDNLASLYTKLELPGVGASIGLDRLSAALEEIGRAASNRSAVDVLVMRLDEKLVPYYHSLAARIREAGLSCEVYAQQRKLAAQFNYGEKKGIPLALICGEDEHSQGKVGLKDLRSRESYDGLTLEQALSKVSKIR